MAAMVRYARRQRPLEALAAATEQVESTFAGERLEVRGNRRTMVLTDGQRVPL
jgi:hypothetical protein